MISPCSVCYVHVYLPISAFKPDGVFHKTWYELYAIEAQYNDIPYNLNL
jgi:hypothetical protein